MWDQCWQVAVVWEGGDVVYEDVLSHLMCPVCRSALLLDRGETVDDEVVTGQLECGSGHAFAVREGVVDFGAQENPKCNRWSQTYLRHDYEELDRRVRESKTPRQLEQEQLTFQYLIGHINRHRPECIVDIGTGRGMFLLALLDGLTYEPGIVCLDRSITALAFDRLKVRRAGTPCRVSYLAADIGAMPLREGSIPLITSYFGLANMDGGTIPAGIEEAHRVLSDGGCMLDGTDVFRPGSASLEAIEGLWAAQEKRVAHNYFGEVDIVTIYEDSPFGSVELEVLFEGVGEPSDDLVPVEGDRYTGIAAIARK
jgi:ubiquinone/menaquinone biosynthesis C-methylase UbiE